MRAVIIRGETLIVGVMVIAAAVIVADAYDDFKSKSNDNGDGVSSNDGGRCVQQLQDQEAATVGLVAAAMIVADMCSDHGS